VESGFDGKEGEMSDTDNGRREETAEEKRAWLEWFERQKADYFWCLNQIDVLDRYSGQVVVLHNRVILGSGHGAQEALDDARKRADDSGMALPGGRELLLVPIPAQVWMDDLMLPAHLRQTTPLPVPAPSAEGKHG
jgi:hypothetical protein